MLISKQVRVVGVEASLLANSRIREQARSHAEMCRPCILPATLFRNLAVIVLGRSDVMVASLKQLRIMYLELLPCAEVKQQKARLRGVK